MPKKTINVVAGAEESGIVVGNTFDKYNSKNPLVIFLMKQFTQVLEKFVLQTNPTSINEIGCGEGYWTLYWKEFFDKDFPSKGCDFSATAITMAKENAASKHISSDIFTQRSIYELIPSEEYADLIICSEVLEHLEYPEQALKKLQEVTQNFIILSVPHEPLWCISNMLRGKYIKNFGNTPGHVQHWSKKSFQELVAKYFTVVAVATPFPFTMVLAKKNI